MSRRRRKKNNEGDETTKCLTGRGSARGVGTTMTEVEQLVVRSTDPSGEQGERETGTAPQLSLAESSMSM